MQNLMSKGKGLPSTTPEDMAASADSDHDADDLTCAICLDQIAVEEICAVKGCEHVYCGGEPCPCLMLGLMCSTANTPTG